MSLDIKDSETVALAEEVAKMTGMTKTSAIREALKLMRARLAKEQTAAPGKRERLASVAKRVQAQPDIGRFDADDLYDDQGVWK